MATSAPVSCTPSRKSSAPGHVPFTTDNVYGVLSIFFWTLTVIVSIKYVLLVLRADNNGEGRPHRHAGAGIDRRSRTSPELRRILLVVGIFGTCLFYGDGVITPAISVLSAIEGLEVVSPAFTEFVIPLTLVILFCLFAVQKRGTAGIGQFFGPITLVWFAAICAAGHRSALRATRKSSRRSARHYAALFIFATPRRPSSSWVRWCCASPAPRRSMPTSAISARNRSASPGSRSSCRRSR